MPSVLLWSAAAPAMPLRLKWTLQWLFTFGEPFESLSYEWGFWSGLLVWTKIVALLSLLCWGCAWLVTALKERTVPRGLNVAALVSLIGGAGLVLLAVMQAEGRLTPPILAGVSLLDVAMWSLRLVLLVWAEWALWSSIRRLGNRYDVATLVGVHVALAAGLALGPPVCAALEPRQRLDVLRFILGLPDEAVVPILNAAWWPWSQAVVIGARMAATFMGYVVLARVLGILGREVAAIRWRRLYSIGWHTVVESYRRMWAPWVVLAVFLVVLAFIHWFLRAPRAAELGRLYVGTLALLGSLLLTVMIVILAPISLPHDIQMQTIYTVVSKPVRRLELIWGRMLGFMVLVTALLVVFGGVSLAYLNRTISKSIAATRADADRARKEGRPDRARVLNEQADQLKTRMAARVPIKGMLSFIDSKGKEVPRGINVGMEMEYRSHIEGATQSLARWRYGVVRDKFHPEEPLQDRRIPVESLLRAGTIEDVENRLALARGEEAGLRQRQAALRQRDAARGPEESGRGPGAPPKAEGGGLVERLPLAPGPREAPAPAATSEEGRRLAGELEAVRDRIKGLEVEREWGARSESELQAKLRAEEAKGESGRAQGLRRELARLHSDPIPLEMTFNIFRTTKGQVLGAPVHAELKIRRLAPMSDVPGEVLSSRLLPIREYYTNRVEVPARVLVGSQGHLAIEVRCLEPNQYLGMAESDMYILASKGSFNLNYMKGLSGVWLQAMVLTAIGVWAGTFLSWPVALLMTIFFFVAGQVAFGFLQEFAMHSLTGGGPFESLVRLLSHENLVNKLEATPAVVTAKTFDALVTPLMGRLVYVVPNFAGMDVSNTVADGFAVPWRDLRDNLLSALAYALPFSAAGYFILKNREVAA